MPVKEVVGEALVGRPRSGDLRSEKDGLISNQFESSSPTTLDGMNNGEKGVVPRLRVGMAEGDGFSEAGGHRRGRHQQMGWWRRPASWGRREVGKVVVPTWSSPFSHLCNISYVCISSRTIYSIICELFMLININ
jgi:hypothetical protein